MTETVSDEVEWVGNIDDCTWQRLTLSIGVPNFDFNAFRSDTFRSTRGQRLHRQHDIQGCSLLPLFFCQKQRGALTVARLGFSSTCLAAGEKSFSRRFFPPRCFVEQAHLCCDSPTSHGVNGEEDGDAGVVTPMFSKAPELQRLAQIERCVGRLRKKRPIQTSDRLAFFGELAQVARLAVQSDGKLGAT